MKFVVQSTLVSGTRRCARTGGEAEPGDTSEGNLFLIPVVVSINLKEVGSIGNPITLSWDVLVNPHLLSCAPDISVTSCALSTVTIDRKSLLTTDWCGPTSLQSFLISVLLRGEDYVDDSLINDVTNFILGSIRVKYQCTLVLNCCSSSSYVNSAILRKRFANCEGSFCNQDTVYTILIGSNNTLTTSSDRTVGVVSFNEITSANQCWGGVRGECDVVYTQGWASSTSVLESTRECTLSSCNSLGSNELSTGISIGRSLQKSATYDVNSVLGDVRLSSEENSVTFCNDGSINLFVILSRNDRNNCVTVSTNNCEGVTRDIRLTDSCHCDRCNGSQNQSGNKSCTGTITSECTCSCSWSRSSVSFKLCSQVSLSECQDRSTSINRINRQNQTVSRGRQCQGVSSGITRTRIGHRDASLTYASHDINDESCTGTSVTS